VQLSICIATFNRARFIGETLASIAEQLRPDVEVVILDGGSSDNTTMIVDKFVSKHPSIRYHRENINSGLDVDYDKAVQLSKGRYCWLMTDDDIINKKSIDTILHSLDKNPVDVMVVDAETSDLSLKHTLNSTLLSFPDSRNYTSTDLDKFLIDSNTALAFIGTVIVSRKFWMSKDRSKYYGSMFIHVGTICQSPAFQSARILNVPMVKNRLGNAQWRSRSFEIWTFNWPKLIWSFDDFSHDCRNKIISKDPWKKARWLIRFRALGAYDLDTYKRNFAHMRIGLWHLQLIAVAIFPGKLANFLGVAYLILAGKGVGSEIYDLIFSSRFSNVASRILARGWLGNWAQAAT
jgi:abequosyltransferase